MLTDSQLSAWFDGRLDAAERTQVEATLADDPQAQQQLAVQENMDLALRVLLGPRAAHDQVRDSIFAVLRGSSEQRLADRILAETRRPADEPDRPAGMLPFRSADERTVQPIRRWRKWLPWLLARWNPRAWGTALAALAVVVMVWVFGLGQSSTPTALGHLVAVVGTPHVVSADGRAIGQASVSLAVHLGDHLETGDADKAEIRFLDGTTLRLGFNTRVEIGKQKAESGNFRSGILRSPPPLLRPAEVHLIQGQVWTQVQKAAEDNPQSIPYAIRTEAATAIARGTEFGVKLQRTDGAAGNPPFAISDSRFATVLTVREGVVDFTNAHGTVQATAMTESTATVDSAPTEPRRLETLQMVQLSSGASWSLTTSSLDWPEAATKLVGGGGSVGWELRDVPGTDGRPEVRVSRLPSASPTAQAGLRLGDTLVAVDGQVVTDARQIASAVLFRPGGAVNLRVRREAGQQTIAVTVHAQTSALRGPELPIALRTPLSGLLRQWLDTPVGPAPDPDTEARRAEQAASLSRSKPIRAAAFNQLGVAYELEDALGPAIRAYGRAASLEPDVPLYRFNLGLALRKIGSFERALEEFEAAVRLEPGSVPARIRVAEVTTLLGRHEEALALAEGLAQTAAGDHGVWELQAQLLLKLQRPAEAILPARQATELDPDCPVARAYLAEAYHDAGRPNEALAAWTEALERAPFEPAFLMNLGTVQRDLGQIDAAEQSLRRAIALRPDFALAHRNLGEVLADRREFPAAAKAFQRARDLDPMDVDARLRLGDMALQRREFALAGQVHEETLEAFPTAARAWYGLGESYRLRRQSDDAERAYRRAIELQPNDADPHTALGILFYDRGEVEAAERLYRLAIELNPREPAPYHNLGNLYREALGDLDAAEQWFEQALERAPGDGDSLGGLALVAKDRGNLTEAERLLRQAVEWIPDSSELHNNLGEVLRQRGRSDEAETFYQRAIELDPDNMAPYGNLGIVLAERKQFAEAEKTFRALLERSTGHARLPALVNLAAVCGEQGKLDEAERLFREALELAPNHPRVMASLASFLADHRRHLDEALALATRAVDAMPEDPQFLDALGWVQTQRGELGAAERTLQRALDAPGPEPLLNEIRRHWNILQSRKAQSTEADP